MPLRSCLRSTVRRLPSRLPGGLHARLTSRRRGQGARWRSYQREVEPKLLSRPRVHTFAAVPLLGEPALPAHELAVWIDDALPGADRTSRALASGSVKPAQVLAGPIRQALANTRSDYVVLLGAGDRPAGIALERLGQALALAQHAQVLTCDDDRLERRGVRAAPRLRPGPSPDRWLAVDDSGPLLLVRREPAVAALSQLTSEHAWRHELALRLAGAGGEHHAHVPLLLYHRAEEIGDPPPLDRHAIAQIADVARVEDANGVRRLRRPIDAEPSVEVIICFRDAPELLRRCLGSLLEGTSYERLNVALVDNGSTETETREILETFTGQPNVRVLRDERPFNFARLNNSAARSSKADVLVFLNNDTKIIDRDWLEPLLEEALRPPIGAVAPLLLFPDGRVQHAGAAIGLHGYAGHPFARLKPDTSTPFGYAAQGTRNWLAVTAACMVLERAKFEEVGGFDESFVVAGNDVDLCLRLTAAGYRSLCVPHSTMLHDESRSRGAHIDLADFVRSERSYGEFRAIGDPFYNPSLTLTATDCGLRHPNEV